MASENSTSAPVAIVTGAGQGLGKAIALKLVSDGYSVILADLSTKQETLLAVQQECKKIQGNLPPQPNRAALIQFCDVRVEEEVEELVNTAVKKLGSLDVMVANAGVAKIAPLIETTGDDIDTMHSINVKGLFYCYRAAARVMIPAGTGKIIGACSVAAKFELPLFGAYSMSKAAVRSLTHTAAREWAPHGITVNAYAPGAVDTNMWTQDVMGGNKEHPIDAKALEITPTGKKSTPEQIAALVSFFLSPAAENITGQCISIDGGIHMD